MPAGPGPSLRANTRWKPAWAPFVIHIFSPDSTQSVPSSRAVVVSAAASDPQLGSLSAKLAGPILPDANGTSHCCCCATVACSARIFATRLPDARITAVEAHDSAIASSAST